MPLKDHAREIQCVTDIATLIKYQVHKKLEAQYQLLHALKAVEQKKVTTQDQDSIFNALGIELGAWA